MLDSILIMALAEIRRNVMRSGLTALGIVIGVASVIAMMTVGDGASAKITDEIAQMGTNLLIVSPGVDRHGPTADTTTPFTMADVKALRREVPGVAALAPVVSRAQLAVFGNKNYGTTASGTTNDYFVARNIKVALGRTFNEAEAMAGSAVCVLGETPRKELFGAQDPVGAVMRVGSLACTVIGVVGAKGQSTFGMDQDDFVLMPLTTVQRRIAGNTDVGMFFVSAADERTTVRVQNDIEALLRERRQLQPNQANDFSVRDTKELAKTMASVTQILTALLGAIAAVSLLVGGIGIMNIMLVAVTERTREIGIRLAIGARAKEVLWQFLIEAVVLSVLGGAVGVLLGLCGSWAATRALSLPFNILPEVIVLALGFSAAVGITFGYFPARRAARLNPIEALRYE